jgi:hypothetical protein
MFLMSDTTNFSKRRSKVKSFIRKGKVVRSYDRSIRDRLTDVAIGATGTALLGGAYLLGKRNGARSLDEVKSLIKNIKPEVTVNVPTPIVNVTNTPSVVREVINNTLSNNTVKEVSSNSSKVNEVINNAVKLDIVKVKLPAKVNNLSQLTINKTASEAAKMNDVKLERTISLISNRLQKYNVSNDELFKLDSLLLSLNKFKTGKFNKQSEREYLRKQIIEYRDYFKLPKVDVDELNVESVVDRDYATKLKKVINRDKSILDIYQSELTKRRKVVTNITTPTDDDIDRLSGMLDDFSSSRRLALFNDTKSRRSFFLTDTNVPKLSKLLNR